VCVCVCVCVYVCVQSSQRTAVEPRNHRSADWTLEGYSTNLTVSYGSQTFLEQRSTLFWDITQRITVITYQNFGTTYRSHLQDLEDGTQRLSLKMGSTGRPETSARNCHDMLRNIPEERRSHLIRGGSQKSHIFRVVWNLYNRNYCQTVYPTLQLAGQCLSKNYFYSKTNQMQIISHLSYFGTTLYMFRTVLPSIVKSLRLYIQHHTIQVLWLLASKQPQNLYGMML